MGARFVTFVMGFATCYGIARHMWFAVFMAVIVSAWWIAYGEVYDAN